MKIWPELKSFNPLYIEDITTEAKYDVYTKRQRQEIEIIEREQNLAIPSELDINLLSGISNELKQKIIKFQPKTIGQAAKIEGITSAALVLLAAHAHKIQDSKTMQLAGA